MTARIKPQRRKQLRNRRQKRAENAKRANPQLSFRHIDREAHKQGRKTVALTTQKPQGW